MAFGAGRGRLCDLRCQRRRVSRCPKNRRLRWRWKTSPAYLPGAFHIVSAIIKDEAKLMEAFRTGDGVGWDEHDAALFRGNGEVLPARITRPIWSAPGFRRWTAWKTKLKRGARVADVGCGHGASTILMAQAYPNSQFVGFDYHGPSMGRRGARRPRPASRMRASKWLRRKDFHGAKYDFVTFFDCLHDMGDPVGAAQHVLRDAESGWRVDDRGAVRAR